MVLKPQLALVGLIIAFTSCGWTPQTRAPKPQPAPSAVDLMAATQALAFDIAFFEAQGDSGLALGVAQRFDQMTGCTSAWTLGYWQEEQRAEEIVARSQAMVELDREYEYVAGAIRDAMMVLPYTDSSGNDQQADFVGVLAAVSCS